jgi:hypothetical protein
LAAPDLDAVLAAAGEVNAGYEAACHQREAELARVRYEADLAQRRFAAVDPANRLVWAVLARDYDAALEKVRTVERMQADHPLAPPLQVTPESLEAIRRLGTDLPRLWAAPSTTDQDRKLVIRLLIKEIRVVAFAEATFEVDIAWVGGATTRHRIYRPFAGPAVIRELAAEGLPPGRIVEELQRRSLSTLHGTPYTSVKVRRILYQTRRRTGQTIPTWAAKRDSLRAPLRDLAAAGWSDSAIASEFNCRGLWSPRGKPWTMSTLKLLRHRFGIPAGRYVRGQNRRPILQVETGVKASE